MVEKQDVCINQKSNSPLGLLKPWFTYEGEEHVFKEGDKVQVLQQFLCLKRIGHEEILDA